MNPALHLQSEASPLPSSEYELIRHSVHVAEPLLDLYFPAHKQERRVKQTSGDVENENVRVGNEQNVQTSRMCNLLPLVYIII